MIPKLLTLEGVFSYQTRQTIDFDKLTQEKLFGIFGTTGSGKSTILEAIIFVLYGSSERLGSTNYKYNMMNLSSNRMFIDFEFIAGTDNTTYRATYEAFRNSKDFNDINRIKKNLYKKIDNNWQTIPLESNTIENIIGLSKENFRRIVIIPQGKFQEFLKLGGTDRSKMMMEIFPELKKYDFSDKITELQRIVKEELATLQGKQSTLSNISEEEIQAKNNQLNALKFEAEKIDKELEIIQNSVKEKEKIKEATEKLTSLNEELNTLNKESENIKIKEQYLNKYLDCIAKFKSDFEFISNSNNNLKEKTEERKNKQNELGNIKKEEDNISLKLSEIQQNIDNIEIHKEELNILKQAIVVKELTGKIKEKEAEISKQEERISKGLPMLNNSNAKIEQLKKETADINKLYEKLQTINDVINWFSKQEILLEELNQKNSNLTSLQNEIEKNISERTHLLEEIKIDDTENYRELILQLIENQESEQQKIEEKLRDLYIKNDLKKYTEQIVDGQPCPLCGSIHHPDVIEIHEVNNLIKENENFKAIILKNINKIKEISIKIQGIDVAIAKLEVEIQDKIAEREITENKIEQHKSTFTFSDYNGYNKDSISLKHKEIQSLIDVTNKKIEELRKEEQNAEKYKQLIDDIQNKITFLKTELSQLAGQLQAKEEGIDTAIMNENIKQSYDELNKSIIVKQQFIEDCTKQHAELTKKKNESTNKISGLEGNIQILEKDIYNIENQINIKNKEISDNISNSEYNSIEEVKSILVSNIDTQKTRTKIDNHRTRITSIEAKIKDLKNELGNKTFDNTEYQQIIDKKNYLERTKDETKEKIATERMLIQQLCNEIQERKNLQNIIDEKTKRSDNLNLLYNLFKGKGFVKYVSSIYLEDLCRNANTKFRKMTNNQLELTINEKTEFELIDYMNSGRRRAIDTLSGGQTFQAALSLALALIDNIRSGSNSQQKFFFLDEGFGSQDKDSLNQIFESLKQLRHEDRIVGIISHIEELQQKITACISVVKDDSGSRIK